MQYCYTKRYAIIDLAKSIVEPTLNADVEWLAYNFGRSATWYGEQDASRKWAYRDFHTFDYIDRTFYFAYSEDYLLFVLSCGS